MDARIEQKSSETAANEDADSAVSGTSDDDETGSSVDAKTESISGDSDAS